MSSRPVEDDLSDFFSSEIVSLPELARREKNLGFLYGFLLC
jgi:hypothetical protein